jgi:hypothetical protein
MTRTHASATSSSSRRRPRPRQRPQPQPLLDQLNQLTTLHEQGALTDDEFTAAKAKLLG